MIQPNLVNDYDLGLDPSQVMMTFKPMRCIVV